jgi:hypothetical protein
MTYTYTVTSYSYTCQVCGTRSHGVPKESEIPRCYVCDIALCNNCFQHGFCPTHWNRLPSNLQEPLAKIHRKVIRRRKIGFVFFILCIICSLGVMIGAGSAGRLYIALPVGFSLLFLAIIAVVPAMSPINRLRKKIRKYLASHAPGQVTVQPAVMAIPPQGTVPPAQTNPAETKKFCSYCGASINKDAVFCEKCGAKLGNP